MISLVWMNFKFSLSLLLPFHPRVMRRESMNMLLDIFLPVAHRYMYM